MNKENLPRCSECFKRTAFTAEESGKIICIACYHNKKTEQSIIEKFKSMS